MQEGFVNAVRPNWKMQLGRKSCVMRIEEVEVVEQERSEEAGGAEGVTTK